MFAHSPAQQPPHFRAVAAALAILVVLWTCAALARADDAKVQTYLVFSGATLRQATDEFNRHNAQQLVIDDPQLAAIRIGGRFRISDPRAFVAALAQMGVANRTRGANDQIVLVRPQQSGH